MNTFITLTTDTGRSLINLRHITAVVEHEGKVYVALADGQPGVVQETYDEIMRRIELGVTKIV